MAVSYEHVAYVPKQHLVHGHMQWALTHLELIDLFDPLALAHVDKCIRHLKFADLRNTTTAATYYQTIRNATQSRAPIRKTVTFKPVRKQKPKYKPKYKFARATTKNSAPVSAALQPILKNAGDAAAPRPTTEQLLREAIQRTPGWHP